MIRTIDSSQAIQDLLTAIQGDRLVLMCGAGLSMDPPSKLQSAMDLARRAKSTYVASRGPAGADLPDFLEQQAEYFYQHEELGSYFIRVLIPRDAFAAKPNPGHTTVADFLLCRAIEAAISTNVDTLIEDAGHSLFGEVEVALDGAQAEQTPRQVSPLLKIHGCWSRDRSNTIWTIRQLENDPARRRIDGSVKWLELCLGDKDVLVVGFWSDWSYLNAALGSALGTVHPSRVTIVDLAEIPELSEKAPDLCSLGESGDVTYRHVKESGAEFLNALRIEFSKSFVRNALHKGSGAYKETYDEPPDPAWLEPPPLDAEQFYAIRRDIEGRKPGESASIKAPDDVGPLVGFVILMLRARGAVPAGYYWRIHGKTVRVIWTQGDLLHTVKKTYERDNPPVIAPDVVICVGAEDSPFLTNIARGTTLPNLTRGGPPGEWLTLQRAKEVLDL